MSEPVLRTENLAKRFGGLTAVDNLSIGPLLNFQPHRITLTPVMQLGAHRLQQRSRLLFLKVEVAVARYAKCGSRQNLIAAIHARGMPLNQIVQKDEVMRAR